MDSLETTAAAVGVEIALNGENAPMRGVPQLLYSIVYNLCDNAIKYNHHGGKVSVTVINEEHNTMLYVKDTGIGIPQDSLDRIFERFYRVDKSRSKEVGGTGLGLSIVKHAVLIHKAQITVNSVIGDGTEFIVKFPKQ